MKCKSPAGEVPAIVTLSLKTKLGAIHIQESAATGKHDGRYRQGKRGFRNRWLRQSISIIHQVLNDKGLVHLSAVDRLCYDQNTGDCFMEHQFLSEDEVAGYLNLSLEDIRGRVKCREIPFQTRGRRVVFDKGEIDLWASQRILNLPEKWLAAYHQKSSQGTAAFQHQSAILPQMIQPDFMAPAMTAKTKASVLRELADLADKTGRLNNPKVLLESLEAREALCSTGMPGGFAMPHPRTHDAYLFESSFIVVGRSLQPINFGAPDGGPTQWFFLVCCQDDRLHLHILARLCFMAQKTQLLVELNAATDADSIFNSLITAEAKATADRR